LPALTKMEWLNNFSYNPPVLHFIKISLMVLELVHT
jgi:hypothetical protein